MQQQDTDIRQSKEHILDMIQNLTCFGCGAWAKNQPHDKAKNWKQENNDDPYYFRSSARVAGGRIYYRPDVCNKNEQS